MNTLISVRDAFENEGEFIEFSLQPQMEPVNYMGEISFHDIAVTGRFSADGTRIHMVGEVSLTCTFECDRCLKNFDQAFVFPFNERFEPDAEEEILRIPKNQTIDFQPLLNDIVLSSLPIERLCKEDCKGLCPHCGIDKNFSSCSCEAQNDNNPFAALRGLVD